MAARKLAFIERFCAIRAAGDGISAKVFRLSPGWVFTDANATERQQAGHAQVLPRAESGGEGSVEAPSAEGFTLR